MKKLFILIYILLGNISLFAQGVNFEDLTLEQALIKAKQEKKLVFLDGYTSWCGPCKWMSEEVFTLLEAGEFFNKHFVNVKFDLEKGEGKEIKEKYNINAYPTFLILKPDGDLQHVVVGADTLHLFIPRVERGLNKKTSLGYLKDKYDSGKLSKKESLVAIYAFQDAYLKDEAQELADKVFNSLSEKERLSQDYWKIFDVIGYSQLGSDRFTYLVENSEKFSNNIDVNRKNEIIRTMFMDHLINHIDGRITKDNNVFLPEIPQELPLIRDLVNKSSLSDKEFYATWTDLAEAVLDNDKEKSKILLKQVLEYPEAIKYSRTFRRLSDRIYDGFVIEGVVPGAPDGMEVSLTDELNGGRVAFTEIKDGKFRLEGKVDLPTYGQISFRNENLIPKDAPNRDDLLKYLAANVYFKNADMVFEVAHVDSIPYQFGWQEKYRKMHRNNYKLIGSEPQEYYERYRQAVMPYIEEMENKNVELIAVGYNDYEAKKRLSKEYAEILSKFKEPSLKFLSENYYPGISTILLSYHLMKPFTFTEEEYDKVAKVFNRIYENGRFYEMVKENLETSKGLFRGLPFKDFPVEEVNGKESVISDYMVDGKYTLIDFWASWCVPCLASIPNLKRIHEEYQNKVEFISLSCDRNIEEWKQAMAKEGMSWTQLRELKNDITTEYYKVTSIPRFFVISPDKKVLFSGNDTMDLHLFLEDLNL